MADLFAPTIDEQIKSVEREIAMRVRFYARWVQTGKMTQEKSDTELGLMRAVLETLERVKAATR